MSQKYYDMIVRDDTSRISGSIETRNYKKKKNCADKFGCGGRRNFQVLRLPLASDNSLCESRELTKFKNRFNFNFRLTLSEKNNYEKNLRECTFALPIAKKIIK